MKNRFVTNLDNQYSKSAQKIRAILQEGSGGESKISDLTISRIQERERAAQYMNIAKRLRFLFKNKQKTYHMTFLRELAQKTRFNKLKQRVSLGLFSLIVGESQRRSKIHAYNKMLTNRLISRRKQQRIRIGSNILSSLFKLKKRTNLLQALAKMRIKFDDNTDIIKPKTKSQIMRTPKQEKEKNGEQNEQQLSVSLINPLKQLVTYDPKTFVNMATTHLQAPLEIEVRKIGESRDLKGQKLLLVVLNNHLKAIIDLKDFPLLNGNQSTSTQSIRRSFNQKTSVAMYEQLGNEFFESDQQLNKLIIISNDTAKAQGAIQLAIKNYTSKNYRFRTNKLIQSRVRVLELLLSLLRSAQGIPISAKQVPPLPQLKHQGNSFKQLQVSHVRLIVQQLDHKVYQLSTISQQIPQLQTFKRTLDLTMPQHNMYLTKIVDVLIQLHHKINKLISRRPQKLLKQIQAVEQQCLIIQIASNQFLTLIQSQTTVRVKPIYFDQRKNNSPDYFRKIQKNVVKLSQIIIQCIGLQQQAREKIQQIKAMIEVFWNLLAGMEQYEKEWKNYRNRENKTADQQQILQLLDVCLKFVNDKIDKINEEFEIQRQTLIDGNNKNIQYLQEDLNKLTRQYQEQRVIIGELERQNQLLTNDYKQLQSKYKELLRRTDLGSNDYQNKIIILQKRQKTLKDKIDGLQAQNEQKKIMIANLTNDMKRMMKQAESSWRADQKNKDLEQYVDKLNVKIQDMQAQLRKYKLENDSLKDEKVQLQKNNDLLIKRLEEANRKIIQLQNELDDLKYRSQREKTRSREEIQQLQKQVKKLNNQMASSFDNKGKKDEKISQLNQKIIDLNSKLNEMLNNYKNMQFELKRKQRNQQTLNLKLKQYETKSTQYKSKQKDYEKYQKQLNNALQEVDKCKNKIVPQLQAQIKRRDIIIAQLQEIVKDLQEKQSAILNQQQNYLNLRRYADELQDRLRHRDNQFKAMEEHFKNALSEKDRIIKQLQNTINLNKNRISQLQSSTKLGNDDANKKIKQLEGKLINYEQEMKKLQKKLQNAQQNSRRVNQLQGKLSNAERDARRIAELQSKISNLERQLRTAQDALRQANRNKQNGDRRLRQLQLELNNLRIKSNESSNANQALQQAKYKLQKMNGLQIQLNNARNEIARLKRLQLQQGSLNNKILNLQSALNDRNKKITELQARIRALQIEINNLNNELSRSRNLMDDLRAKDRQLALLRQQKLNYEASKANLSKNSQYLKQIQYLKQKIRSLQDLIDIFTQQHGILQAKIKQYRLRQSTLTSNKNNDQKYEKLTREYNQLTTIIKSKDDQILGLKRKMQQQKSVLVSPIQTFNQNVAREKINSLEREIGQLRDQLLKQKTIYSNNESSSRERIIILERQIGQLRDQFSKQKSKYDNDNWAWANRQKSFNDEINRLKYEIQNSRNGQSKEGDKYYLRVQGQRLQELIKRMENGTWNLNSKLDQVLSNSRRVETTSQISTHADFKRIIEQNRFLVDETRKIIGQKQQLSKIVMNYPNPDYLTQYVFRIIIYFAQIHPESPQGKCIWNELQRIRTQSAGEQYFIILEQFTKFTLQQSAIEVYRRQLKQRIKSLQFVKTRIDGVIESEIVSEKRTYEKTALTQSRVLMFKQKLASSTHSNAHSSI